MTIAPLSSKIMGTVLEVHARAGDRVRTGQVLAVIDSRETEAMVQKSESGLEEARLAIQEAEKSIEAARANLQLASVTLKRYQELLAQKSVSLQEFDEVQTRQLSAAASLEALQAKRLQAEARIRQAQSDISASEAVRAYARILCPFDGVVSQRQAEPGSLAVPGMHLLTVEETNRYRLEVPIDESQIPWVKIGETVSLEIESLGPSSQKGRVSEILPSADPSSRTYLVKIDLPRHPRLRSGMYGQALFVTGSRQGIWIRPQSIIRQGQLEGVYVLEKSGIARLRLLKLGEVTDGGIEVLSGLEGGEAYVVEAEKGLHDGSRVEVAP
jgi:RND family efflux transporter MFP subunit